MANFSRCLAVSKLTYGLELLSNKQNIQSKPDHWENALTWLDNLHNKSLMNIFGCRYNENKEVTRVLLGLQSISSHAKSLKISFFLRLKTKTVPASTILKTLYKQRNISNIREEINEALAASSLNWRTATLKNIPTIKRFLKEQDIIKSRQKLRNSNSEQNWIIKETFKLNKTANLEILESLNLTSRVHMWFHRSKQ